MYIDFIGITQVALPVVMKSYEDTTIGNDIYNIPDIPAEKMYKTVRR